MLTYILGIFYTEIKKEGKSTEGHISEWTYCCRQLMLNIVRAFWGACGAHLRTASPKDKMHLSIDFQSSFGLELLFKALTPPHFLVEYVNVQWALPGSHKNNIRRPRQEARDSQGKQPRDR